jgi:4-amino-4-deoxy-L-arabinose transferase-like glycosyltransferase
MRLMSTPLSIDLKESEQRLSRARLALLWLAAGVVLLVALGRPPVTRTQEARVAETARQMLGTGWRGWMLPMLNGEPRLKKPPLAYWMAAGAYLVGGPNEWSARLPTVIVGWLTLGVTFAAARWLFDTRAALLASSTLLGSFMFFRHVRLAETDAPAMLFVTLAIYAWWRGAETVSNVRSQVLWYHLGAAATALGGSVQGSARRSSRSCSSSRGCAPSAAGARHGC